VPFPGNTLPHPSASKKWRGAVVECVRSSQQKLSRILEVESTSDYGGYVFPRVPIVDVNLGGIGDERSQLRT
jgi:hypothetical protein